MPNIDDVTKQAEITNFDEARQASEAEFEQPVTEETQQETPAEETPPAEQSAPVEQTLQLAEAAAQVAQQKDSQLQEILQQNQALQQQLAQMQQLIQQQSQQTQEQIVEEIMEPPVLDINSLMYDDEETAKSKVADFSKNMFEYAKSGVLKEISPYIEQVKQAQQANERAEVVNTLSQVPELAGFKEMLPQIENIIKNNPILQNAKPEDAYINAYMIAKGVSAVNTPQTEPTPEQILEMIQKNPEAQKLYEQSRLEKVEGSQQVPQFTASSGANAALNIAKKPTTLEEARERTLKMFEKNH
jgi:hypothetical protein